VRSAFQWGIDHFSCSSALVWRESLGADATQADAWLLCERGDWLMWQIVNGLTRGEQQAILPALFRATDVSVDRVVRAYCSGHSSILVSVWARRWLSGENRSVVAAATALSKANGEALWAVRAAEARADAARVAWELRAPGRSAAEFMELVLVKLTEALSDARLADAAESLQQASDIRREISTWPGEI